jgi:hypothetical protein
MTPTKLKSVFQVYVSRLEAEVQIRDTLLKSASPPPRQFGAAETCVLNSAVAYANELAHLRFMCEEAQKFVDQGRIEKAMRWLGFLQGVLWARGFYSLDDLKNHSKP